MDKFEKIIQSELSNNLQPGQLNVDAVLDSVHSTIRRRSRIRKTLYSSPAVILLFFIMFALYPGKQGELPLPGTELLMAGWESSWTESQSNDMDEVYEQYLYDQSIDYLTDEQYYLYENEANELFDANDIEAFLNYLEEV